MLEPLLESPIKERILLYLLTNKDSFPREIAANFSFNFTTVLYQLRKMEHAGLLYSQLRGKVRLYGLNPRYPFRKELEALLQKAYSFLPQAEKDKFYIRRRRP
ncbi:MAG: winged helix-turn-helix domain-containing protein [Acidobacteria bacterium]|jgi:predicted transcriptional regulator|nr:winged helix-turn-helix domain-containing protein [Acidobacteriota bacterium]